MLIYCLQTQTDDVYQDFYEDKILFGFSNYSRDSKFFDPVNKRVIGKMKNEFKGGIISEFIGLKSKTYSLVSVDGKKNKKAKGVDKNVVKNKRHKELVGLSLIKKIDIT